MADKIQQVMPPIFNGLNRIMTPDKKVGIP